ncbi:MAG: hypothetical protein ABIJ97_16740, partial [Bacteroidota bacterium]
MTRKKDIIDKILDMLKDQGVLWMTVVSFLAAIYTIIKGVMFIETPHLYHFGLQVIILGVIFALVSIF